MRSTNLLTYLLTYADMHSTVFTPYTLNHYYIDITSAFCRHNKQLKINYIIVLQFQDNNIAFLQAKHQYLQRI